MTLTGWTKKLLLVVLLAHLGLSLWIIRSTGFWSLFPPFSELSTYQIFSDLSASLIIVLVLLYLDLKRRRKSLKPLILWTVVGLFVGSIAPLIYLLTSSDFSDRKS